MPIKDITLVVDFLVQHWLSRLSRMDEFLEATFSYTVVKPYTCDKMFIMQMKDGDAKNRTIGTFYLSKWMVKDGLCTSVTIDFENRALYELNEPGDMYIYPRYVFTIEGDDILISERYGPDLVFRSFGKLIINENTISCSLELDIKSRKFEILKSMNKNIDA